MSLFSCRKIGIVWVPVAASLGAATLALLSGCQSVQGSAPHTLVRVIDASYSAKSVDVTLANTLIAYNIAAPSFTSYAVSSPQKATASIYPTGTKKAGASVSGSFEVNEQHSVLITDAAGSYAATILSDQITAPPAGDVAVRFVQEAQMTGAVDVYLVASDSTLADAKPLLSNLTVGSVTNYINVAAGTYTVVITPAGNTKAQYTGTAIPFAAGQVRTLLVVDSQLTSNPPVTVVVGDDLN